MSDDLSQFRMLAIDLDGTLLDAAGRVSEASRAAIRKVLDAGLIVVFATGRSWTESRAVLDAVEHYDSAIFVGGAVIADTAAGVTLHRVLMQPALARDLCRTLESAGHPAIVLKDREATGVDYHVTADRGVGVHLERWFAVNACVVERSATLGTVNHADTLRVGVITDGDGGHDVRAVLDEQFHGRVFHHTIRIPAQDIEVIEIFDPSVNKWEGIRVVAARRGIDLAHVIAIGDDVNDLHMVRHAGLGVAMGNAVDELKSVAKRIIGSNREDGLAAFLNEIAAAHRLAA